MKKKTRSRKQTRMLRELSENPLIERACKKVGIARSTYYRWCLAEPFYKQAVDEAQEKGREKINDFAESKLMENMSNNHFPSLAYWLSHNTMRYRSFQSRISTSQIEHLKQSHKRLELFVQMMDNEATYASIRDVIIDRYKRDHMDRTDEIE